MTRSIFYCCFFFQAEDGIRDVAVTGVQTCALPIYRREPASHRVVVAARQRTGFALDDEPGRGVVRLRQDERENQDACGEWRSEERRVGKECRSRWAVCD